VRRDDGKGLALWEEAFYATMVRNAAHVSDILRLPADQVVEIGRQISI
jgi:KUP system potassium uptake protein